MISDEVLKKEEFIQYCGACGRRLLVEFIPANRFSERTGSKLYKVEMSCPNKSHWYDHHRKFILKTWTGYDENASPEDSLYNEIGEKIF